MRGATYNPGIYYKCPPLIILYSLVCRVVDLGLTEHNDRVLCKRSKESSYY